MTTAPSVMKLHLYYRLFIAEMNSDINILRIFDDYTKEIVTKNSDPEIRKGVDYFKLNFIRFRKEIDYLRDEMHVKKMKLLVLTKERKLLDTKTFKTDNHNEILKQYKTYKKNFDELKKEFIRYVGKNLH